jgi:hypothetical protein
MDHDFIDDLMKKGRICKGEARRDKLPRGTIWGRFTNKEGAQFSLGQYDGSLVDGKLHPTPGESYVIVKENIPDECTHELKSEKKSPGAGALWSLADKIAKATENIKECLPDEKQAILSHIGQPDKINNMANHPGFSKIKMSPPLNYVDSNKKALEPEAVLIKAQNVHDYFVENYKRHHWDDLTSFSCVRPSYPNMVITYDHVFQKIAEDKYTFGITKAEYVEGTITRHIDLLVRERDRKYFEYYLEPKHIVMINPTSEERWSPQISEEDRRLMCEIVDAVEPDRFIEVRAAADAKIFPGCWFVMIDETGQVLQRKNHAFFFIVSPEELAYLVKREKEGSEWAVEAFSKAYGHHGAIALATLQFMNCKNVIIHDNPPTRQQRRQAARQGKRPPVTYKTLEIVPIRKILAKAYVGSATPLTERALHIVRGHMKDYRYGRGLGKFHIKGLWWWHPQTRGTEAAGRVVKDYEVRAT